MTTSRLIAWLLFFLYAVWAASLQGVLAAGGLGDWTPDLGLLLLCVWAGRLRDGRGPMAALLVALARASFGADPPVLLAAVSLGSVGLFAALRTGLEVDRALPRAFLSGACAWLSAQVLIAGRSVALASETPAVTVDAVRLWPGALLTALGCLLLAPLVMRLPGLSVLGRSRR